MSDWSWSNPSVVLPACTVLLGVIGYLTIRVEKRSDKAAKALERAKLEGRAEKEAEDRTKAFDDACAKYGKPSDFVARILNEVQGLNARVSLLEGRRTPTSSIPEPPVSERPPA